MPRKIQPSKKPDELRLRDLPVKTIWTVSGSVLALIAGAFVAGQMLSTKLASIDETDHAIKLKRLETDLEAMRTKLTEHEAAIRDQSDKEQFISLYTRFLRADRDVLACSDPGKKVEMDTSRVQAEDALHHWFIDSMRSQRLIWKKSPDSPPTVVFQDGTSWRLPDSVRGLNCAALLMRLLEARPDQERPEIHGKILLIFP